MSNPSDETKNRGFLQTNIWLFHHTSYTDIENCIGTRSLEAKTKVPLPVSFLVK